MIYNLVHKKEDTLFYCNAILFVAEWDTTTKQQKVKINDLKANAFIIIDPERSAKEVYKSYGIRAVSQEAKAITFEYTTEPTIDIPIKIGFHNRDKKVEQV